MLEYDRVHSYKRKGVWYELRFGSVCYSTQIDRAENAGAHEREVARASAGDRSACCHRWWQWCWWLAWRVSSWA